MFGSNYSENFGLPRWPWTDTAHNQMFGPSFSGMEGGQPVPGTPGGSQMVARADPMGGSPGVGQPPGGAGMANSVPGAGVGQSANPSVDALRSGNPLAVGAGLPAVGSNGLAAGAGASPQPGAGAPAIQYARPGFGV